MASDEKIMSLLLLKKRAEMIPVERIFRDLGNASLPDSFKIQYDGLLSKINFASEHAQYAHDNHIDPIHKIFLETIELLYSQCEMDNANFVTNKENFISDFNQRLEELKQYWPSLVASVIEPRGILDKNFIDEAKNFSKACKAESQKSIDLIREEYKKLIEEAQEKARQIEGVARKTATGVSIEEAQNQFKEAQTKIKHQIWIWSFLSLSSISVFTFFAKHLLEFTPPDTWTWQIVYYTSVRITIFTVIIAIMTFCLRTMRAFMHLSQQNYHRQRLSNSVMAFIESASSQDQRDAILGKLVESIADFGHSGLIADGGDSIGLPKISIDNIAKLLPTPNVKS